MHKALRFVWEWLGGWWVTYVVMSRAERKRLGAIAAEQFDPADWIAVPRPTAEGSDG